MPDEHDTVPDGTVSPHCDGPVELSLDPIESHFRAMGLDRDQIADLTIHVPPGGHEPNIDGQPEPIEEGEVT